MKWKNGTPVIGKPSSAQLRSVKLADSGIHFARASSLYLPPRLSVMRGHNLGKTRAFRGVGVSVKEELIPSGNAEMIGSGLGTLTNYSGWWTGGRVDARKGVSAIGQSYTDHPPSIVQSSRFILPQAYVYLYNVRVHLCRACEDLIVVS